MRVQSVDNFRPHDRRKSYPDVVHIPPFPVLHRPAAAFLPVFQAVI